MNKYCMGVVVYNPTISELKNIELYADSGLFGLIMIYDNSPKKIDYKFKHVICQYHFQNENSGLAKPYNKMLNDAESAGYNYLCIMDQDSSFKEQELHKLINAIEDYSSSSDIAAFCPVVLKTDFDIYDRKTKWQQVEWSINSGSFLNISCLKKYDIKYDEEIFLDGLDYDFGWMVEEKKCKIMQYCDSVLVLSFGYKTKENQTFTYHSAYRYYLIAHNRKYIFKKHFGTFKGLIYAQLKNIFLSFRILMHEENKFNKIVACYKGIIK